MRNPLASMSPSVTDCAACKSVEVNGRSCEPGTRDPILRISVSKLVAPLEGRKNILLTHHHDGNTICHTPAAAFQTNPGGCAEAP